MQAAGCDAVRAGGTASGKGPLDCRSWRTSSPPARVIDAAAACDLSARFVDELQIVRPFASVGRAEEETRRRGQSTVRNGLFKRIEVGGFELNVDAIELQVVAALAFVKTSHPAVQIG